MSKRLNIARSIGAFALLTQCVTANADFTLPELETFNFSFSSFGFDVTNDSGVVSNINTGPKNESQQLEFTQFDTGLGTLLGVTVTYQSTYGATATLTVQRRIDDNPADPLGIDFFADGVFSLSLTGIGGLNEPLSNQPFTASCLGVLPGTDCPLTGPPASGSVSGSFNSASPISLTVGPSFEGTGTFFLTAALASAIDPRVFPDNGTDFVDNSTMTGRATNTWAGSVALVYEFERNGTTVPEPMTLYLLLAGIGGLALLRRQLK